MRRRSLCPWLAAIAIAAGLAGCGGAASPHAQVRSAWETLKHALVDGELSGTELDRANAHVAACGACRVEANALRRLKHELRALGEVSGYQLTSWPSLKTRRHF